MRKVFIKNRRDKKIAVIVDKAQNQKGLAFVMHGLGDNKESEYIKVLTKCFLDNAYSVVRLDAANTFGESEGSFEEANITNYYEDYEDVINWAKNEDFYLFPYILCGHSLGALASAWYGSLYPQLIKSLILIGSPINYDFSTRTYSNEQMNDWKKLGYITEDWGDMGHVKIKWSYIQEKKKYDLMQVSDKLDMPILMISGELDGSTSPKYQKVFFNQLKGIKKFNIIPQAPHTFRNKKHLEALYNALDDWIKNIIN